MTKDLDVAHRAENESTVSVEAAQKETSVSGFSPIELLMSLTLLGILAATLVPQMLSSSEEARQTALLHRLHLVRGQIENFRSVHDGRLPGEGRNSAEAFLLDLTSVADARSEAARKQVEMPPLNPYTQQSGILVIPDRLQKRHYSGEGNHGWAYSSTTGEFRANLSPQTKDRSGRLINQLNVLPGLK